MTLSRLQDDIAIQAPFIPEDAHFLETEPENPPVCTIPKPAKTAFYHSFTFISAFTHAMNSFMAGVALMGLIEHSESKSIGEIFWEGTAAISALNLSISSLLGTCSFSVNYAQALDYLPKMKDDLLSLVQTFKHPITLEKKTGLVITLLLSGGASLCSAIFAWDTYNSIPDKRVQYPLAFISSAVTLIMTMATRYVRTKQQMEEISYFYSKEDVFLLKFIKELENTSYRFKNIHRDILGETSDQEDTILISDNLIALFKERGLAIQDRADLEETIAHLFQYRANIEKQDPDIRLLKNILQTSYTIVCTWIIAEVFGEKLAGIFPPLDGKGAIPWNIFRLAMGILFASSHVITYHLMARDISENLYRSYCLSPKKTALWFALNVAAAFSLFNYYLSVADNKDHPPIFPLPKKESSLGLAFGLMASFAGFNLNFDSCASKFIMQEPPPFIKELQAFQKAITQESPIQNQEAYYYASRRIRSTFFKPKIFEREGCFARLRRRLHF